MKKPIAERKIVRITHQMRLVLGPPHEPISRPPTSIPDPPAICTSAHIRGSAKREHQRGHQYPGEAEEEIHGSEVEQQGQHAGAFLQPFETKAASRHMEGFSPTSVSVLILGCGMVAQISAPMAKK